MTQEQSHPGDNQLSFLWQDRAPPARSAREPEGESRRSEHPKGQDSGVNGSYEPGHPWHYYREGDNAPPLAFEAIAPANVDDLLERELPKERIKRLVKAKQILESERTALKADRERYHDVIERGAEALSRYDREIAYGGNDELARASTLALKHNHSAWRKGRIAFLERELSKSVAHWR